MSPSRGSEDQGSEARSSEDEIPRSGLFDRERRRSQPKAQNGMRGRSISDVVTVEAINAHDVSFWRRLAQVIVAILYCFLAAGIIFGFAALKPVLVSEQVYRYKCTKEELEEDVEVCLEQEMKLNLMFIIAAVATNIGALAVGTIMDRYGPRIPSIMGCVFLAIGSVFMAFASREFDGYIPGYLFLALGGPFVFISSFQLSNAFPRYSGLILALLTGAFDASTAIPLFYRLGYEASDGTLTPKRFFLIYLVVPVFILIMQVFLMPGASYKIGGGKSNMKEPHERRDLSHDNEVHPNAELAAENESEHVTETTALLDTGDDEETERVKEEKLKISGVYGVLHGLSAWRQMMTPWFVFMSAFTILQMLRVNYFCATIRSQYKFLFHDSHKAKKINDIFDIALPAGGVVASPFIGVILDNTSTTFALGLLVAQATVIGILGVLPYEGTAWANIVLFVIYRPLLYTTVSDYAAKVFGFDTFGKVWGMIIFIAGLFNFVQSALDIMTHKRYDGDPIPANVLLLSVVFVVGSAMVGYVWYRSRQIRKQKLKEREQADAQRNNANGDAGQGYGTAANGST